MQPSPLRAYSSVFGSALFFFFTFIQINMFNALAPYLIQGFSITSAELGNLSANYFYATVLFLIPAGMILDRVSTRYVIITAMTISIICTVIFAQSHYFLEAALARFIIGLCGAFCLLSSVRLASRWFSGHKMAFIIGCVVTIAMVGGVCAQTPFTLIADHWGWRTTLMLDAGLGAFLLLFIIAFVCDTPEKRCHHPTSGGLSFKEIISDLIQVTKNPQNILAGCYTALLNLPIFLLGAIWGGLYLTQVDHLNRPNASIVVMFLFIGTIVGSPTVGWISDRLQKRILPMIVGAIASLAVVLMVMFAHHLHMPALLTLFFLLGFFTSTQVISYPLIIESNPLALTGAAEGLASMIIMAGGFLQPAFGYLMQWHHPHPLHQAIVYSSHDFYTAMAIMPIGFILSIFICFLLKDSQAKSMCAPVSGSKHDVNNPQKNYH
jgi:predicted MFS family arabinose efflux permease